MARLLVKTPGGQQTVELKPHSSLGRHPDNSIQLLDKIVSKEHCTISFESGSYVLRDLGSLNGTYVNGERVSERHVLAPGDEVALGASTCRFEDSAAAPAPAMPSNTAGGSNWSKASRQSTFGPPGIDPMQAAGPEPMQSALPARHPPSTTTRVDLSDARAAIGTQIDATATGFLPFDKLAASPTQIAADYERLRLSHELSREIALERDLTTLLNKILSSVFRFIRADRGVIFLKDEAGDLVPSASQRRDGSEAPITVSSTILDHVMKERATVLTHDAAMDFAGSKGRSMILNRISSAVVAPLLHSNDIVGVLWLDSETRAQFQAKDMELVTAIAAQAAMFIQINILGRKVEQEIVARERFSRLLSPNVAQKVMSGEMVIQRGGQLVNNCTVFNSDIRGFTRMSEDAEPQGIVDMLNEYFEQMVEVIFHFEGTLDKFMGDGIMALWGAPVSHPDDAFRAVQCALAQMAALEKLNLERRSRLAAEPISVGVGIHTGSLVAGYIGSSKALSYTVIGDAANTSARLCGIAGPGQILVSQETLQALGGKFVFQELAPAILKGKERPLQVFEIQGTRQMVEQMVKVSRER